MKIIGINSSPRPNSNTRFALEKAFEALNEEDVETKIFDIQKMDVKACMGCDYCKSHEAQCVVPDDMQIIYKELETADALVLASPIYMSQLSAQAKLFFDRLYALFMSDWTEKHGIKKVALLISQGQLGKDLYKQNIDTYAEVFEQILQFKFIASEVLTENNVPGAIKEKDEQIEEALNLCKKLIQ